MKAKSLTNWAVICAMFYGIGLTSAVNAITTINEGTTTDYSNVQYDSVVNPSFLGVLAHDTDWLNGQVGGNTVTVDTFTFDVAAGQAVQSVVFSLSNHAISNDYASII